MKRFRTLPWALCTVALCAAPSAHAEEPADDRPSTQLPEPPPEGKDVRSEIPNLAYAYTAHGASFRTLGVQVYALGLAAKEQDDAIGGGGAIWLAPVERLTLVVDAQRNVSRNFSPSAAGIVRLYGSGKEGLSLGGIGKFKIDGFAAGPTHDEVESEIEIGALLSYGYLGWHFDLNGIAGRGLGDDGETDAEGRLRLARDLGDWGRVGLDGQARARLSGPRDLPNGRTWDFAAGPQFLVQQGAFYGSITAGPSTMGLESKRVGLVAIATIGGTTF
jgi:hypothetical protein